MFDTARTRASEISYCSWRQFEMSSYWRQSKWSRSDTMLSSWKSWTATRFSQQVTLTKSKKASFLKNHSFSSISSQSHCSSLIRTTSTSIKTSSSVLLFTYKENLWKYQMIISRFSMKLQANGQSFKYTLKSIIFKPTQRFQSFTRNSRSPNPIHCLLKNPSLKD